MLEYLKSELYALGIDTVGALPLGKCRITRAYKLKNKGFDELDGLSVIMLAIPYYTEHKEKNISSYCIPRDYHAYCNDLFDDLLPRLRAHFDGYIFRGFADDSPIDERHAAALAGLGIIGDNGMLITEKYSSYVFLAEIVTDLPITFDGEYEIKHCEGCGMCKKACPMGEIGQCLSALTQKKGELEAYETDAIRRYGYAWGCDICQEACPHTAKAKNNGTIYTEIDFFKEHLTPILTSRLINEMSDGDFSSRAYSWRKKDTVRRNLSILEDKEKFENKE